LSKVAVFKWCLPSAAAASISKC